MTLNHSNDKTKKNITGGPFGAFGGRRNPATSFVCCEIQIKCKLLLSAHVIPSFVYNSSIKITTFALPNSKCVHALCPMVSDPPPPPPSEMTWNWRAGGLGASILDVRCSSSMYLFRPSNLYITGKEMP